MEFFLERVFLMFGHVHIFFSPLWFVLTYSVTQQMMFIAPYYVKHNY
jgi:hypothetical protein